MSALWEQRDIGERNPADGERLRRRSSSYGEPPGGQATGGAKAHYDCIKAFSETDFTDDLKAITVPTLVMHGTDDQIVPIGASARLSAPLLRNAQTKIYEGLGHGMCTINPDVVNPDLLAFIRG